MANRVLFCRHLAHHWWLILPRSRVSFHSTIYVLLLVGIIVSESEKKQPSMWIALNHKIVCDLTHLSMWLKCMFGLANICESHLGILKLGTPTKRVLNSRKSIFA